MENQETLKEWNENPKYWKWGLFYFNKEDKRLIVDKQNPNYGSTFNFAHPKSCLFFIGMLCFFLFVICMTTISKK